MKKLTIISVLLLLLSSVVFSQTTLKIFSDLEEETSMFKLYLRGQPQDAMYTDEVEVEDLRPGYYTLRLVFNCDTIADYIEKIKIEKGVSVLAYEVINEEEYKKRAGKAGRKVKRFFKRSKKTDAGLVEWYKLEEVPVAVEEVEEVEEVESE